MRFLSALVIAGSLAVFFEAPAHAATGDKPGWQLTWQDEFDGASVDATKWVKRYKWGEAQINGELQAYVDDAFQLQNGMLSIVGDKRTATYAGQTFQYASGVLCSVHEQKYGYFEARLKVPAGQGMWPAFWLLGTTSATGVNEIDIHEILGNAPSTVYMTVHWGTDYNAGHMSDGSNWVGPDFSADFHVFGLEWSADAIVWTIDGVERKRHTGAGVPQVAMYVILNLAIGGSWPGAPNSTTQFPALYQIDYVRAYAPLPDGGTSDGGGGAGGTSGAAGTGGSTGGAAGGNTGGAAGGNTGGAAGGNTGGAAGGNTGGAIGGSTGGATGGSTGGAIGSGGVTGAAGGAAKGGAGGAASNGGGCGCHVARAGTGRHAALALLAGALCLLGRRRPRGRGAIVRSRGPRPEA